MVGDEVCKSFLILNVSKKKHLFESKFSTKERVKHVKKPKTIEDARHRIRCDDGRRREYVNL